MRAVEAVKPGQARQEIPDGATPGLYLIVQSSGVKSWAYRFRNGSRTRKMTLGKYPALSLADARKAAAKAIEDVETGNDPAAKVALARAEVRSGENLVEDVLDDFVKRHVSKKRLSTSTEQIRLIETRLKPAWRGRKVKAIKRADVLAVIDKAVDDGAPVIANRLLALVRKFFGWAVERDVIDGSPAAGIKPPTQEKSRDRVLTEPEIQLFWQACDRVGWPWGDFARTLLLTGQRREEVAGMTWAELTLDSKSPSWLIPKDRAKNGAEHFVPLSQLAASIIGGVTQVEGQGDFVFSTNGNTAVSGFSKGKSRIDEAMLAIARESDPAASIAEWRIHDLRRTFVSGLAALRQPIEVVEAAVNHRSGAVSGVAAIYNRHDYAAEKRKAMEIWARKISSLTGQGASSNVLSIVGRGGSRRGKLQTVDSN